MNSFPVTPYQRRVQGAITTALVALGLALLAFAADSFVATMATAAEEVSLRGDDVAIYNLVGTARIEAGSGSSVRVRVELSGPDADDLQLREGAIGSRQTLRIVYPGSRVIYPPMGRGSNTNLRVRDDGTFNDHGKWFDGSSRSVRITGSGEGIEAHADLAISVPRGQKIALHLAAGDVTVSNVDGDLSVDTGAGTVNSTGTSGKLSIDTGSGEINVGGAEGTVSLDTGSGEVNINGLDGDHLSVDTGSGSIHARDISVSAIAMDTGSGEVEAMNLRAQRIAIDTGSGSVDLTLGARADAIAIDTGSGDVTLRVPKTFGAEISFETGSGGFRSDLPVEIRKRDEGTYRGRLGDGSARVAIESGSGSLRLLAGGTARRSR